MKRGQVFVRGRRANGSYGAIDVCDLDDESLARFVSRVVTTMSPVDDTDPDYRERVTPRPPTQPGD